MKNLSTYILVSTFILASCGGGGGGGSAPEPVATVNLSASDTDLFPGDTTTLTWSSTIATSCTASGSWSGAGSVSGSQVVTVSEGNNAYSLKCGNSRTASVTVVGIIMPSVSIEAIEDINALEEVVFTATITDPQSRFVSSDWSQTTTTGETITYNYTNTAITFSPPQQCNYQTVTPKLVITVDTANNSNGTTATSEGSTTSRIVPLIPEAPTSFAGTAKSQSADFTWNESTGACSYSYYYAYDNGGLTNDSNSIETASVGEGSLVGIINDRKVYFAVSATNVIGESSLSNEVEITATGPSNEFTGKPHDTSATFSQIDYWGNIIDDYSGNSLANNAYCLKNNSTGIIWSIRKSTATADLHYSYGTYSYYDDTNVVNGINDYGTKNPNGASCSFADDSNSTLNCNTQDYLIHLNNGINQGEAYCGVENWRLSNQDEALQNFNLLRNLDNEEVWTSTGMNQIAPANQISAELEFGYPYRVFSEKSKSTLLGVRAISSIDEVENSPLDFTIECIDWAVAEDQVDSDYFNYSAKYTMNEAIDRASLISNQTGIDWTIPTLYELAHFKDKINESPGPTYKICKTEECRTYISNTAEYDVVSTTPTSGTTNETTFSLIRQSDGLLDVDSDTYGNGDAGAYQMCFKGPAGATIIE